MAIFTVQTCLYLLKPMAMHVGLVDTPGGRKKHLIAVPLIGGIAIFMGLCFSLLALDISLRDYRGLLAGSAILLLLGILDDFRELRPRVRLIGQCMAAILLMQSGHLMINQLGNLFFFGGVNLGVWSVVVTILFVLGIINATNMIDGNDGLAGAVVLGQGALFLLISRVFHETAHADVLCLFLASIFVFLAYNFPLPWQKHARVFLGDAGSTLLGFIIAWFAVNLLQSSLSLAYMHYNPVTILWVLAYPLFDLTSVIFHRLRSGNSPFLPSRDHLHFMLIDLGVKKSVITVTLVCFSWGIGLIGILLANQFISESWQAVMFATTLIIYLSMTTFLKSAVTKHEVLS